ncbi:MAG: branched-chain amino acid aminotransferase [Tissierellia bacterium]|nr:branched-chain amino acid aminotransferase [Tissierellia bacterium]
MKIDIQYKENPQGKILDEENMGFGDTFTDHMFTMDYVEGKGWHNARITPYAPISLMPSAMGLHYGQTVFEGMKAYRRKDGKINLFRPLENFKRLNRSNERICIPKIDEEFLLKALTKLLQIDGGWVPHVKYKSLYIRPFIFATDPQLGLRPAKEFKLMIIMSPADTYYGRGLESIKIFVENEYVRAVRGGMGEAKTGGNYAGSLKSQIDAMEENYAQVLWLDGVERKYIEEVGAMNIFFVLDEKIITPQLNGSILPGITRKSSIELLRDEGYTVEEKRITMEEIAKAYDENRLTEIFGTGTAAVISPIGQLKWKDKVMKLGDMGGEVASLLYQKLTDLQWGDGKDEKNWIYTIPEE